MRVSKRLCMSSEKGGTEEDGRIIQVRKQVPRATERLETEYEMESQQQHHRETRPAEMARRRCWKWWTRAPSRAHPLCSDGTNKLELRRDRTIGRRGRRQLDRKRQRTSKKHRAVGVKAMRLNCYRMEVGKVNKASDCAGMVDDDDGMRAIRQGAGKWS